ncbi:ATP-binding cassette domain-containing protein [Pseudomonas corrugata]|uniref:ATP-binding cassette domain-containing protein n=1 Tax=Pseudomonas corrugata TaxID=47879 RepID=UPI0006D8C904|nr:ATP-binding cassette domain-containing protein [Pseudomonas corrugata]
MNSIAKDLLVIHKVTKVFPGVKALDDVTLRVRSGEVHGLVGENGAGKSTLMAVASGALVPETGMVEIAGQETLGSPLLARQLGLAIVRQEPALMPDLTVAENLYMAMPPDLRPSPMILNAWAAERLRLWEDANRIDPTARVNSLNSEQKFIVEIVKALAANPKVLVLDEPTEHLGNDDVKRLFAHIHRLVGQGCAVVYISHRIREVQSIVGRLTVLRDGQDQGTHEAAALSEQDIVELIVGGELNRDYPDKSRPDNHPAVSLRVESLSGKGFNDVSITVRRSEIVGLAGVDGNGQREVTRALAGINRSKGVVAVDGKPTKLSSAAAAASAGIRYVPGDRHKEGIFGELSIRENFTLRSLRLSSIGGFISPSLEETRAVAAVNEFAVKTPSLDTPIRQLSGGNQQKVVLSSVLASKPSLLIVDEPTQGVDVGARMEIYQTLRATAEKGTGILLVSSDASEVAGLCDRVLIFSRGEIVKELAGDEVSEQNITAAVLTATNKRAHEKHGVSSFWNLAAGYWAPLVMLVLGIGLLGLFAAHANEFYLSERNISGMLALVATLALVAFGQQILMLVGGIDLSVGPLMGLVVVIQSFYLIDEGSGSFLTGWVLMFAAAVAVGLFNWFLVDPLKMHPMVATLVTFMGLQACSLVLRPVPGGLISEPVMDAINQQYGFIPVAILVVLAVGLLLEFALFKSRWGLSFRSYGSRPEAARVAGVKPRLVLLMAYVGCSVMTAIAAVPMMAQVGSGDASAGTGYTLTSIAAVVIGGASLFGGRGSFMGALLGALLITQVNVVTTFLDLSDAWQSYLLGAMILVSVALYSKSREKAAAL